MTSIIYKNPLIYKTTMKLLHGKGYRRRYVLISKEVKDLEVLDLCCGDCELAKYVKNYKGADFNPVFVKSARKKGIEAIRLDVMNDEIPTSECIVMQASLYHFIPEHKKVLQKVLEKAPKVIISESHVNLAQSNFKPLAWFAKLLTKTSKDNEHRFDKDQLFKLYREFGAKKIIVAKREIIGVFENGGKK